MPIYQGHFGGADRIFSGTLFSHKEQLNANTPRKLNTAHWEACSTVHDVYLLYMHTSSCSFLAHASFWKSLLHGSLDSLCILLLSP